MITLLSYQGMIQSIFVGSSTFLSRVHAVLLYPFTPSTNQR